MENQNFIRGNEEDATAITVIRELVESNFVTKDQEEEAAARYEADNKRPIRRSWETPAEFAERESEFGATDTEKRDLVMSPDIARRELNRLEKDTKKFRPDTDAQRRFLAMDQVKMNELRRVLGEPEVDYSEESAAPSGPTIAEKIEKAWPQFAAKPEGKRLSMINLVNDHDYLRKIASEDESEAVREKATERLAKLTVG